MNEDARNEINDIIHHQSKRRLERWLRIAVALIISVFIAIGTNWYYHWKESNDKDEQWKATVVKMLQSDNQGSRYRDSLIMDRVIRVEVNQGIIQMQFDTMINYQTPELIKKLNLINAISKKYINGRTSQVLPPLERSVPRYSETVSLLDEIESSLTTKE